MHASLTGTEGKQAQNQMVVDEVAVNFFVGYRGGQVHAVLAASRAFLVQPLIQTPEDQIQVLLSHLHKLF